MPDGDELAQSSGILDELDRGNTLSSLLHMLLLRWHRLTRDNRAAILNNGTCGQVPAFRRVFRTAAR